MSNLGSSVSIGIDLGTTNSSVTVGLHYSGKLTLETIGIDQEDQYGYIKHLNYMPSVVQLSTTPGYEHLVGIGPYESQLSEADGRIAMVKNKIGSGEIITFMGKQYTPADISALIIKQLVLAVQNSGHSSSVESAVITIPASFTEAMKNETHRAAEHAGIPKENIYLLYEPVAALLNLLHELESKKDGNALVTRGLLNGKDSICRVLVFDMGGGTVDVTVYEIQECWTDGNYRLNAVGKGISPHVLLGGHRFDLALCDFLLSRFIEEKGITLSPEQSAQLKGLWLLTCENQVKKKLSNDYSRLNGNIEHLSAQIKLPMLEGGYWSTKISYSDLAKAFDPLLACGQIPTTIIDESDKGAVFSTASNIMEPIWITLQRAFGRIQPEDIDLVLSVGGMAHLPLIRQRLEEFFGNERLAPVLPGFDLNLAVSRGAAIHHHQMMNKTSLVQTLIPHIELQVEQNGRPIWLDIIPKNTLVHCGELFRKVENKLAFPENRKEILLPLRTNGQVRGAARFAWPETLPSPKELIPLVLELEVDAQHTTISGTVHSRHDRTINVVFSIDELAPIEIAQAAPDISNQDLYRQVRTKLCMVTRSPLCSEMKEVDYLIHNGFIQLKKSREFTFGVLKTEIEQEAIRQFIKAKNILNACIGSEGPADFLSKEEAEVLESIVKRAWIPVHEWLNSQLKNKEHLISIRGCDVNVGNNLLVLSGNLKSMAPKEAAKKFLKLADEIPQLRGEALHAFGRCVRCWSDWELFCKKAGSWALTHPQQYYRAASWSLIWLDPLTATSETINTAEQLVLDAMETAKQYITMPKYQMNVKLSVVTIICTLILRQKYPNYLHSDTLLAKRIISASKQLSKFSLNVGAIALWEVLSDSIEGKRMNKSDDLSFALATLLK